MSPVVNAPPCITCRTTSPLTPYCAATRPGRRPAAAAAHSQSIERASLDRPLRPNPKEKHRAESEKQ